MSFEWKGYLEVASKLVEVARQDSNLAEAYYRTILSRAYYGAFIATRNHLRDVDKLPIDPSSVHQFVILACEKSPNRAKKKVVTNLRTLKEYRQKADYEDVFSGKIAETAKHALQLANEVFSLLDTL